MSCSPGALGPDVPGTPMNQSPTEVSARAKQGSSLRNWVGGEGRGVGRKAGDVGLRSPAAPFTPRV